MSNWTERAEQERRRLAAETAAAHRASETKAQQNAQVTAQEAERLQREQEVLIFPKLKIFDQFGIPRILEGIRRDLWKGRGTIKPIPPRIAPPGEGSVGVKLTEKVLTGVYPKTELVEKRVYGEYSQDYGPIHGES